MVMTPYIAACIIGTVAAVCFIYFQRRSRTLRLTFQSIQSLSIVTALLLITHGAGYAIAIGVVMVSVLVYMVFFEKEPTK